MSESSDSFVMEDEEPITVGQVMSTNMVSAPALEEESDPDLGSLDDDEEQAPADAAEGGSSPHSADGAPAADVQPDSVIPLSKLTVPKNPSAPKKGKKGVSEAPFKIAKSGPGIPILNSSTANPDTYDLDRLLDRKVQKKAETGDRFSAAHLIGEKANKETGQLDFVKMNIERAARPQTDKSREEGDSRIRRSYQDPVNVEERFYKYRKNVEEKVKHMEEELMKKEAAVCTFTPSIIGKRGVSEGPRSSEEFYQEMMRHKQDIEDKVKNLREESKKAQRTEEHAYFQPQLCAKSMAMLEAKGEPEIPVHEKLYQAHKLKLQRQLKAENSDELSSSQLSATTQDSAKPFHPVINKISQNLIREKPIEVHLLEDAERRLKKLDSAQSHAPTQKLISSHSEQLLLKKFKDELESAWGALDEVQTGTLNYTKVGELLKTLHFIDNESEQKHYEEERALVRSMWTLMQLNEESALSRANLETLLVAVMNFPVTETDFPSPEIPEAVVSVDQPISSSETQKKEASSEPNRSLGHMENGLFLLYTGDAKRIHFHFKSWYERRAAALNKSNRNPTFKEVETFSFKPELGKNSQKLVGGLTEKRSGQGFTTQEDYLISEQGRKQERQKELTAKLEKVALKECVFKPKVDKHSTKMISSLGEEQKGDTLSSEYLKILKESAPAPKDKTEALYNLATVSQQRRKKLEKTPEELALEKHEIECTFAPDLKKTRAYVSGQGAFAQPAKGIDKAVERMTRARHEAEEIKRMRETGLSYRGEKPVKETESKSEGPLVVLAVQVSGRAEELRVRPGDDLESLISAFTSQHRLTPAESSQVQDQLRSQYAQATGASLDD